MTQQEIINRALNDALATLYRWMESCPSMWDERDQETLDNIKEALGIPKD